MSIRWTDALAVGHDTIDGQHQELFRRLGALLEAMQRGDRAEVARLFEFLGAYVVEHFDAEERLMLDARYAGFSVHKAAHERFTRDYQDLKRLFDASGPTAAVTIRTKSWLVDWLEAHIAGTDQALAQHLRARSA
jgi:hemerythrin